jgi:uncharacterized protein (DUF1778 family)
MATITIKHQIIKIRITEKDKAFLQKAAEYAGFSNLIDFIMTVVRSKAQRILSEHHTTYLSSQDWDQASQLMRKPPKPHDKLKKLLNESSKHGKK